MDAAIAKDMAEMVKMANIVAKSKRLPYISTALGLAIRKMIAISKEGLKKLKHNNQKDEIQKQDLLG